MNRKAHWVSLSHPIREGMPVYPGAPPVSIRPHRLIQDGHKYNSYAVSLFNHCGTHVDAPRHVHQHGPSLSDFPLEDFRFERPHLISIPLEDGELIDAHRLRQALEPVQAWDFLIIRTGFGRYREREPERYAARNPGLAPEAARWLIEHLPGLRAIGVDLISLTAGGQPEAGWEAHRALLDPSRGRRLVVEDMHLPPELPRVKRLWIVPLAVEGVDSSWCTALAELADTA